jgi:SAM-dependent methyltransferase
MELHGLVVVCSVCRGDLAAETATALRCAECGRNFPIIAGIPDLRLETGPYISLEEDRAKALLLERECTGLDFAASVQRYYELADAVPAFQARRFIRSLLAAAGRAAHSLERWESVSGAAGGGVLLEIGCGTAPLLVAASGRYPRLVGVDIALRWLVMARKRLTDAGLDLPLVCASAESLPFRDQTFDRIVLDSTIEHVRDQRRAFAECRRTLRAGGWMYLSTPNRFSLGPDPHTGLPAGGWLPETLTAAYVRWRGGRPPERRLLSAGDLRRSLRAEGLDSVRIGVPDVPAAQRAGFGPAARRLIDGYHVFRKMPLGRQLLERVGPLLDAVARKPPAST